MLGASEAQLVRHVRVPSGVFDTTGVLAGTAVLAAGVLFIGSIVARFERRLLRWKPEPAGVASIDARTANGV